MAADLRPGERGTALVLVPAMTLVVIVLLGIAIDLTSVHAAQRSAQRVVAAAADDAAGLIDARQVQLDGTVRIDPDAARAFAVARIRSAGLPGRIRDLEVEIGPDTVRIRLVLVVGHPILGALPGVDGDQAVPVRVSARLFT